MRSDGTQTKDTVDSDQSSKNPHTPRRTTMAGSLTVVSTRSTFTRTLTQRQYSDLGSGVFFPSQISLQQFPVNPSDEPAASHDLNPLNVWLLGISIVLGGQYIGWNRSMNQGLYTNLVGFLVTSVAYINLCCCTAEINGVLPFAGGSYNLARCTLGFLPGFLVGCCETLEYIAYVSTCVVVLAHLVIQVCPRLDQLDALIWTILFLSTLAFQIQGGRLLYYINSMLGSMSLIILLVFCLGSLSKIDFNIQARDQNTNDFQNGFAGFMRALPGSAWFFIGVEALGLTNDCLKQSGITISLAQVACVVTLFFTGMMVFFVSVSLPPGMMSLHEALAPFDRGFMQMFHLSQRYATILTLPAAYATISGFMWCYGKFIASMARSRLLPEFLGVHSTRSGTPYAALVGGSVVSFGLCAFHLWFDAIPERLFGICAMSAFISYTGQCLSYITLRAKYHHLMRKSSFRNPFGIPGALLAVGIWIVDFVAAGFYQHHNHVELVVLVSILALLVLYYSCRLTTRQSFSREEYRVLLEAHLLHFNSVVRSQRATSILPSPDSNWISSSGRRDVKSKQIAVQPFKGSQLPAQPVTSVSSNHCA